MNTALDEAPDTDRDRTDVAPEENREDPVGMHDGERILRDVTPHYEDAGSLGGSRRSDAHEAHHALPDPALVMLLLFVKPLRREQFEG